MFMLFPPANSADVGGGVNAHRGLAAVGGQFLGQGDTHDKGYEEKEDEQNPARSEDLVGFGIFHDILSKEVDFVFGRLNLPRSWGEFHTFPEVGGGFFDEGKELVGGDFFPGLDSSLKLGSFELEGVGEAALLLRIRGRGGIVHRRIFPERRFGCGSRGGLGI